MVHGIVSPRGDVGSLNLSTVDRKIEEERLAKVVIVWHCLKGEIVTDEVHRSLLVQGEVNGETDRE